MPGLPDLPEVWHAIAAEVEAPQDILSLARVSHEWHDVVAPHHLPYRAIYCRMNDTSLWSDIVLNPLKAKAVRKLTIRAVEAEEALWSSDLYDSTARRIIKSHARGSRWSIRSGIRTKAEEVQLCTWLGAAANAMSLLRSLAFSLRLCQLATCLPFLSSLGSQVTSIQLVVAGDKKDGDIEDLDDHLMAISALQGGYRSFSWTSFDIMTNSDNERILACIVDVLVCCPDLERLRYVIADTPETSGYMNSDILCVQRWEKLRKLDLGGFDLGVTFVHFCEEHNDVDYLRCIGNDLMPATMTDGLARLRTLEVENTDCDWATMLLQPVTGGLRRRIKTLSVFLELPDDEDEEQWVLKDVADLCCGAARANSVRHLSLLVRGWEESRFLPWLKLVGQCVQSIQVITLHSDTTRDPFGPWVDALSHFPHLKELGGKWDDGFLSFFVEDVVVALDMLKTSCTNLRQVDDYYTDSTVGPWKHVQQRRARRSDALDLM